MQNQIQHYKIVSQIGSGGMGSVYLGEDEMLDRKVAIKVLNPQLTADTQFRDRFRQEAKLQASLIHPNIVALHSFFEDQGSYCMVMEYAEGETLKQMIERIGPIPEKRALRIFGQMLEAVGYAHSKGIIHRDIKPSNIIVDSADQVKVMDFGIAKLMGDKGMTKTGAKMGTLYYMSPEQIKAAKDIDQRTDIYSLGITLFEMVSGQLPFDANTESEFEIMQEIVNRDLPDPRKYYPDISENIVESIRVGTAKDRKERIVSIDLWEAVLGFSYNGKKSIDTVKTRIVIESDERGLKQFAIEKKPVLVTAPVTTDLGAARGETSSMDHEISQTGLKSYIGAVEELDRGPKKNRTEYIVITVVVVGIIVAAALYFGLSGTNEKAVWDRAVENNQFTAYEEYLQKYPDGKYKTEAVSRMEYSFWSRCNNIGTLDSYEEYISKYPEGKHKAEALSFMELRTWQQAERDNSVPAYRRYLQRFPYGIHATAANACISRPPQSSVPQITENELMQFVHGVNAAASRSDLDGMMGYYADRVNYFSTGNKDKNFIRKDKDNYFRSYNNVNFQYQGDLTFQQNGDVVNYSYRQSYDVHSPKRALRIVGEATNYVQLRFFEDGWKIVDEKQKMILRRTIND